MVCHSRQRWLMTIYSCSALLISPIQHRRRLAQLLQVRLGPLPPGPAPLSSLGLTPASILRRLMHPCAACCLCSLQVILLFHQARWIHSAGSQDCKRVQASCSGKAITVMGCLMSPLEPLLPLPMLSRGPTSSPLMAIQRSGPSMTPPWV